MRMIIRCMIINIHVYIYICILYAPRDFAKATQAWRLKLGARGARFLSFGVLDGLCGLLGDPLVYWGVSGGSLGAPWDHLGCLRSLWEFLEGPKVFLGSARDSPGGFGNH